MNSPITSSGTAGVIPPAVVWLTGLSGSGKSTIAERLAADLRAEGADVELLDGDRVREVFPNTGFSRAERNEHIRRIGFLAALLEQHGVVVIAALVSPYRESRDWVRGRCRRFLEVHIATPLEECERRDVKGLYARARRGEIRDFTGISDPYEPPAHAELTIDTTHMPVEQACRAIRDCLARGRAAP